MALTMVRVGVVERGDGDDHVDQDAESTFEVVGLLIPEEVAHNDDGEDEDDDVEDFEVEVHALVETPTDDDDEGRVEESGLEGCAKDVGECEVHLVVPSFVNGGDVLGGLLDQRHKDETHEAVRDAMVLHDEVDFLN